MKRKVGLFLLAVLLTVSLGATVVASLAMYRLVSGLQTADLRKIEASLGARFAVFETMLQSENARNHRHMETVLPRIAADVIATARDPRDFSQAELDALAKKYGVEHLYFINRQFKIFQTNLPTDLNMQFPKGAFTEFLEFVFGTHKVESDGIDLSTATGTLRTYSYFAPPGQDYILEASTDVRTTLRQSDFGWMSKFFFQDFFTDAIDSNPYVRDVDIFVVNISAAWSLLHIGEKLPPTLVEAIMKSGRVENRASDGRLLTIYSRNTVEGSTSTTGTGSLVAIRKVTYDLGLAREAVLHVFVSSMAVLAVMLPFVYWLASRLLQRQILDPLFSLRGEASAIADGDLEHTIANVERRDEIGHLARSFASMRDAVRTTIGDLKETNLSIERFVPHAFLAKLGKPNIVSVELGDNKRQDMTILFSDIRNFTSLSEGMSPDENFAFINAYLERMGPVIRDHGGFIDKYIGDAIMALFENPDDGLRAGLAMLSALDQFNAQRGGQEQVGIGIGLNTGSLMMGTIGEHHRMDGTVISDAVNLASRIESLTKVYHVRMLISQHTFDQLADPSAHAIRPIDVVVVKGKTQPVILFEVFEQDEPQERALKERTRDSLLLGVRALIGGDSAMARRHFEESQQLMPGDPAAANLLKSCS